MKVGSYNIRGLGGRLKKEAIRNLVRKKRLDFICIQETKLDRCDKFLCQSLWGDLDVDWIFRQAQGSLGGLLCIWSTEAFVKQVIFEGNGFLGVSGLWGKTTTPCYIFNIYAPCSLADKRILWGELKVIKANYSGFPWCVVEDFNAVRSANKGKCVVLQSDSREMFEFDEFIEDLGLNDLPMIGRKYTWHRPNGSCMSRLDRFLL